MRLDDQRSRSLWAEQGDDIYGGRHLSLVQDTLDETDNSPSHATGLTILSAPRTGAGQPPTLLPAGPPNFPEAA